MIFITLPFIIVIASPLPPPPTLPSLPSALDMCVFLISSSQHSIVRAPPASASSFPCVLNCIFARNVYSAINYRIIIIAERKAFKSKWLYVKFELANAFIFRAVICDPKCT